MRFYQFEQLLRDLLPAIHDHFHDLNIETHMYASQWFLTLYTSKFPLYMVYRIIDLFLYHGFNVRPEVLPTWPGIGKTITRSFVRRFCSRSGSPCSRLQPKTC
jgi:hypothetical protein